MISSSDVIFPLYLESPAPKSMVTFDPGHEGHAAARFGGESPDEKPYQGRHQIRLSSAKGQYPPDIYNGPTRTWWNCHTELLPSRQ